MNNSKGVRRKLAQNGAKNERENELKSIFNGVDENTRALVWTTVENVLFIEARMAEVSALPMIRVHPTDPTQQRATPAAKLYKEFLQQHTNCVKLLASVLNKCAPEEESPLRQWLEERKKMHASS